MDNLDHINLDLMNLQIDSVKADGVDLNYAYDFLLLSIDLGQTFNTGDTSSVTVYYQGTPTIDESGFGGLDFNGPYAYVLGIGLDANPHNYGRSWYPCFDNFRERATYDINITHNSNHSAHAIGTFLGSNDLGGGKVLSSFRMDQLLPTYLTSMAVSDYETVHQTHNGIAGDNPIELIARAADTSKMKASFEYLPNALDALESWWGPYQWEKVGYVATIVGAMEHPTLTAYPDFSFSNGNPNSNMALMAHELAHHWWGNVTTLTTEGDMWIKEGNAEYGEYLFYEHYFGRNYFLDVVRDNHAFVLKSAHITDDGYRALSGMPNEYTYGTHTYYKGATVMHTLRGYLGDELYKSGLSSILENYAFSHIDAAGFRDQVSAATGVDLTSFFNDWIFNPGYSAFEIDSIVSAEEGGFFSNKIFVEQKLLAAPEMHTNVPIWLNIYGSQGEIYKEKVMVSDQFSVVEVGTNFEPAYAFLNEEDHLNQARTAQSLSIKQTGPHTFEHTDLWVDMVNLGKDSIDMRIEHYWVAPDDFKNNPNDIRLSSKHYWSIEGNVNEDFLGKINFGYNGSNMYSFDYDLTSETEDSIILLYRRDASQDWFEYAYAEKKTVFGGDGIGYFKCDSLLMGQYTFGNGAFLTGTDDIPSLSIQQIDIYPNPATDYTEVHTDHISQDALMVELYSVNGQLLSRNRMTKGINDHFALINTSELNPGNYVVHILEGRQTIGSKNLIIQ
jgi:aminopeptidase N